jgi:integrase
VAIYKQKGSKVLWFEFNFDGVRIRRSAKTTSKKLALEAQRVAHRQLEENFNGIKHRKPPKQFAVAAEEYLIAKAPKLKKTSLQIEEYNIRHLLKMFKGKLLTDITAADVKRYQDKQLAAGASVRSVNLDVGTLRGILRRNRLWEDLKPDISMLRDNSRHGQALAKEEEERLLAACKLSDSRILYPVVLLALSTGMRRSELRWLTWEQIDLHSSLLRVGASKTVYGENRILTLNNRATEMLKKWANQFPDRKDTHYIFPAERGGALDREGIHRFHHQDPTKPIGSWVKAWIGARKRAGLTLRFHDLRHTAVTRMLEGGVSLQIISKFLGWSASTEVLMSKRYGHIGTQAFRRAVAFLE